MALGEHQHLLHSRRHQFHPTEVSGRDRRSGQKGPRGLKQRTAQLLRFQPSSAATHPRTRKRGLPSTRRTMSCPPQTAASL